MRLLGKNKLQKLKAKNLGNKMLCAEIDKLISDFDQNDWKDEFALKEVRKDADCIHNDGFYFFDIAVHRAMIVTFSGKHNGPPPSPVHRVAAHPALRQSALTSSGSR